MGLRKSWISALAGTFFTLFFLVSCEEELDTLGEGVIGGEPFITDVAEYNVFAYNERSVAVQTNRLPLYQVGVYDDPIFGRREAIITSQLTFQNLQANPTFGNFSQSTEDTADQDDNDDTIDEEETVKEVFLYLPYQVVPNTNNDTDNDGVPDELDADPNDPDSDSDGDNVSDSEERANQSDPLNPNEDGTGDDFIVNNFRRSFALDSIFSRRFTDMNDPDQYIGEKFNLKVERSTFFLRELDPNANFEEVKAYFSNTDVPSFVEGEPLFEGEVTIDNKEIVTFFDEDDEETEQDETQLIETRLNPGVRVPLNTEFFQQNILDKEGSFELLSSSNFVEFLRGLHISATPVSDDLMVLFDLSQANITITYEFNDFITTDTGDNNQGDIEKVERDFTLNFLQNVNGIQGNAVNTFVDAPLPPEIEATLGNSSENASRLYLKGGAGTYSELRLFDEDAAIADNIVEEIKANNWIINEANLIFHVDRSTLNTAGGTIEPPRLYLYKGDNGQPLYDIATEQSTSQSPLGQFLNYDGILERESNGNGSKYTVRITEYLNDIIVRDSTNAPLRLALTSNLAIVGLQEAESSLSESVDLPVMNAINPLGTVLYGPNLPIGEEEKKLKLQIFYTETN